MFGHGAQTISNAPGGGVEVEAPPPYRVDNFNAPRLAFNLAICGFLLIGRGRSESKSMATVNWSISRWSWLLTAQLLLFADQREKALLKGAVELLCVDVARFGVRVAQLVSHNLDAEGFARLAASAD